MLRFLRVRNFALIDQLELQFESGFNLLSGETGAGKSIIVDALGLLAGSKASAEMVRSGEARAVVEAAFEIDLKPQLERLGLDAEDSQVVIRREISGDDRNRVFVNNQPSTVSALRELSGFLLDIHGQHEQQTLLDPNNQLSLLDAYAGASELASRVRNAFEKIQQLENRLEEITRDHAQKLQRLDLLDFQLEEIGKANPMPGETERARERLGILANAGKLLETASRGYEALYESDTSILSTTAILQRSLRDASAHDPRLLPILEQIEAARISLQDIAYALRDYAGQVETDPHELERLQNRLSELERLHRKYGPDLIQHAENVRRERDSLGLTESKKNELQREIEELRRQYDSHARTLSRKRKAASRSLQSAIISEVRSLAMPHAEFEIRWQPVNPGRASGLERPELLMSANPGEELRPLEKIASGGELSRVMLALRTVLAADRAQQTLVFDEVDSGVGGKAAETIGKKLQELSSGYQVLCVTHLAQIAAFADHQYRIEKKVTGGRSVTRVELLQGEARIEELARMMSGSRVTEAAREHVRELLGSWRRS